MNLLLKELVIQTYIEEEGTSLKEKKVSICQDELPIKEEVVLSNVGQLEEHHSLSELILSRIAQGNRG